MSQKTSLFFLFTTVQSAQGGNNKEEMARRASLEFASATNNTHLAPTIHHRGLDHPGEGAPQATSAGASETSTSGAAAASKAHPTAAGDSSKSASAQAASGGSTASSSGNNKKTPNNSRLSGSGKIC